MSMKFLERDLSPALANTGLPSSNGLPECVYFKTAYIRKIGKTLIARSRHPLLIGWFEVQATVTVARGAQAELIARRIECES
ncbi:unnamed protein product [Colias eurytheme]|nr:unnamed protein product [Colias eurytheme]